MDVTVSQWGEYGPRPEPDHRLDELFASMTTSAEIEVAVGVDAAWALVSDIERIGEFSPECVAARWLPDQPSRAAGGAFEGRNRVVQGDESFEWVRLCRVQRWEPPVVFSWTAGDRFDGSPASAWTFTIAPTGDGVLLRQDFAHVPDGLSGLRSGAEADVDHAPEFVQHRLAELEQGMAATLARMKQVLESSGQPAST